MENGRVRILTQTLSRLPGDGGMDWDSPLCQQEEAETTGEYYERGGVRYCLYEEQPEGWEKPCKVLLKWKEALLERQIRGEAASRMVFEPGNRHRASYRTSFGDLLLETDTHWLQAREEQGFVSLALEYGIRQQGQTISENRVQIRITPLSDTVKGFSDAGTQPGNGIEP